MVIGETMNQLLQFLIQHYSFLYDECGARFVDSQANGGDAMLVLEQGDLRIRFVRDRAQVLLECQSRYRRRPDEWFSLEVIRRLLRGMVTDNEVVDGTESEFVKANLGSIREAFSKSRHATTENSLREYKKARAKRLFG
jgi:hypothetical protein